MSRSYRRRSYKRKGNSFDGIVGLLVIGSLIAYSYGASLNNIANFIFLGLAAALLILVLLVIFKVWRWWHNKQKKIVVRYMQEEVDTMSGLEFEHYVADLMKKNGYQKVRLTEHYDLGVDIIAHKDGIVWGVQVKRYSGMVKAAAVRQVVTALRKYKCDRAMVVTNAHYSRPAKELAESNDCKLIDGYALANWVA